MQAAVKQEKKKSRKGLVRRGTTWRFRVTDETSGKQVWVPCQEGGVVYTSFTDALAFKNRFMGTDTSERIMPSAATFYEVATAYLDHNPDRNTSLTLLGKQDNLKRLQPLWNEKMTDITWVTVDRKIVRPMELRYSPNTIHNTMCFASKVFEYAMKLTPPLRASNPVRLVSRPERINVTEAREVTPADFNALMGVEDTMQHFKVLWALELLGGLRSGEARGVQWENVFFDGKGEFGHLAVEFQLERGVARDLAKVKTRAGRREVPMTKRLHKILREWQLQSGGRTGFVVTNSSGLPVADKTAQMALRRACKRAGLATPYPTAHDFRHAWGSAVGEAASYDGTGVDSAAFSKVIGHTKASFTIDNYVHSRAHDAKLAPIADAVEAAFG